MLVGDNSLFVGVHNIMTCATVLSWEEKNPKNWIYRPSEAMKQLRREF